MFRLPDFSVVVWLRKTDGFAALKGELLGAAATEPYESTEYQGMVDFHWSAANLSEAKRLADALRGVAQHPELVVTDHEPGRWRGLSLDQRRATHEALTGVCLVLAAPTRLLLRCMSPKLAPFCRSRHCIITAVGGRRADMLQTSPNRRD